MVFKVFAACLYMVTVIWAYSIPYNPPNEIIMSKRSAAVLSKLILQSMNQWDGEGVDNDDTAVEARRRMLESYIKNHEELENLVNLQRRGPKEETRKYLRCYFNAVSCF